jgi:hypothetical protein
MKEVGSVASEKDNLIFQHTEVEEQVKKGSKNQKLSESKITLKHSGDDIKKKFRLQYALMTHLTLLSCFRSSLRICVLDSPAQFIFFRAMEELKGELTHVRLIRKVGHRIQSKCLNVIETCNDPTNERVCIVDKIFCAKM